MGQRPGPWQALGLAGRLVGRRSGRGQRARTSVLPFHCPVPHRLGLVSPRRLAGFVPQSRGNHPDRHPHRGSPVEVGRAAQPVHLPGGGSTLRRTARSTGSARRIRRAGQPGRSHRDTRGTVRDRRRQPERSTHRLVPSSGRYRRRARRGHPGAARRPPAGGLRLRRGGAVQEYDREEGVVWQIEGDPGYVYRAQRIRSLYHPEKG